MLRSKSMHLPCLQEQDIWSQWEAVNENAFAKCVQSSLTLTTLNHLQLRNAQSVEEQAGTGQWGHMLLFLAINPLATCTYTSHPHSQAPSKSFVCLLLCLQGRRTVVHCTVLMQTEVRAPQTSALWRELQVPDGSCRKMRGQVAEASKATSIHILCPPPHPPPLAFSHSLL